MSIKEELEKSDNILEMLLNIIPTNIDTNFMKSHHNFDKIDRKINYYFSEEKLSENQKKQLISAYEQFRNILEDILKEK